MSFAPYDTTLIEVRLRAQVTTLREVSGAADYAAVRALKDYPVPCAYVVLAREKSPKPATPAGLIKPGSQQPVRQLVNVTFGIVHAVRNYREQRGGQLTDELREILAATRGAIVGFVPDVPGTAPCQWIQGDIQNYDASTALWIDVYQTKHMIGRSP